MKTTSSLYSDKASEYRGISHNQKALVCHSKHSCTEKNLLVEVERDHTGRGFCRPGPVPSLEEEDDDYFE